MLLDAATKLLDEFRKLPAQIERPRTFMEIAGYPHYENVCSNILAFFMDPEEPHGLGTLVLDALAAVGRIATADEGVGGNVSVEREVVTNRGNRIDILITSDEYAILVENKIYAVANNPFKDYAAYLDKTAGDRNPHKLLLTLDPTSEGRDWGFENFTYKGFIEQIRSMLGRYVSNADTRYLTIFLDFLNTLENLQEGTRMNQEFLKLLSERSDDVQDLLTEVKSFKDELRQKVKELRDLINVEEYGNVERQDIWRGGPTTLLDVLYHNIRVAEDLLVCIHAVVTPHGWEIQIFPRFRGNPSQLRDLLQRLDIPFEEKELFIHPAHFAYDENLKQISSILQEIIDKLATYREA